MKALSIPEFLQNKQLDLEFNPSDFKRIPKDRPVVFLANRWMEGLDEYILLELADQLSVPVLAVPPNDRIPPEFQSHFLDITYQFKDATLFADYCSKVIQGIRENQWRGRSLALILDFPGGRFRESRKIECLNELVATILGFQLEIIPIRIKGAKIGPFSTGRSTKLMQRLMTEPLKVQVRIGQPIRTEEADRLGTVDKFRRYLQSRIYSLGTNLEVKRFFTLPNLGRRENPEPIAPPVDPEQVAADIAGMTFKNLVASHGEFDLFVANAREIPSALNEIGRLREWTFREVGEGTGKALDLDEYDLYYHQLILWDRNAKRIAGGYRMGKGDQIFARYEAQGFYISSLFKINPGFYEIMQQSVELGRSYIVPDYQKKRMPLFLLWKGILHFLIQNPQYRYVYGPVSISKYYSNISKSLIVAFIKKYYYDKSLAKLLKPRKPFKLKVDKVDIDLLTDNFGNELKQLDTFIEDIEPEHFRMPVLMRQYIKLNARFISFNVDPKFSNVLDGFILLNLEDVPYSMIEALQQER